MATFNAGKLATRLARKGYDTASLYVRYSEGGSSLEIHLDNDGVREVVTMACDCVIEGANPESAFITLDRGKLDNALQMLSKNAECTFRLDCASEVTDVMEEKGIACDVLYIDATYTPPGKNPAPRQCSEMVGIKVCDVDSPARF